MAETTEVLTASDVSAEAAPRDPALEAASQPFVGRWNQLVSTTNWEKGRIIREWREALIAAGAPAVEYSDDAWARRVGGVTGQHVGRLRRVAQRFGEVRQEYPGLYWTHFHAALDWDDAEMWLEGAVQSRWSVSEMRRQRWQALGAVRGQEPRDADIVAADTDEDAAEPAAGPAISDLVEVQGPSLTERPDAGAGAEEKPNRTRRGDDGAAIFAEDQPQPTVPFVRPFENLAELPEDLAEAFEAYKLAILRHKAEGWQQITREDVLASLDALKELALAPSVD
jgi:hypothetical protein